MNNGVYLITGGYGFIGSHIIDLLLKEKSCRKIINIDYLGIGSNIANIPEDNRIINYNENICSESIHSVFEQHLPQYIIHCAAESHVDRSISDPLCFASSNLVGTTNILEAAKKYVPSARIVHVSTDEVYGHLGPNDPPFIETTSLNPRSPYSASKAGSDLMALAYKTTFKSDLSITRCCNNYGPRQHDEKLIPTVIRSIVKGDLIPVYGTGENIREWIYVTDHAAAILEVLHTPKEQARNIYNIFGSRSYSNIELITKIIETIRVRFPQYDRGEDINNYIRFVEDRLGHDFRYDIKSLHDDISCLKTQRSFDSCISETVCYYIDKYEKETVRTAV